MKSFLVAISMAFALPALAQSYPSRPIRVIVPQPPGGGAVIGTDLVAKADPDGYTLVARNDLPLNSLKEVVDYARANPGKLTYASAGNGSDQHISAALIWHLSGVSLTHIPYKGAQAVYQDLIPGRVDLFFDASSTARGQIEAARVKPLAVTGPARLAYHANVQTVRETGVLDFEMESWSRARSTNGHS